MESKKFDFGQFLKQLGAKITSYTEIHLLQMSQTCINFTVRWIISHKHKNYRFICSPQHIHTYAQILLPHLELYPIRRCTLGPRPANIVNLFNRVFFDEIFYHQGSELQYLEALHFAFEGMTTKKLTFTQPISFQTATNIIAIVHNSFPKSDVNIQLKVDKYTPIQVIHFLRQWGASLPQKPALRTANQRQFGDPFTTFHQTITTKRRQQITVIYEQTQMFSLRQLDNLGCEMFFCHEVNDDFLRDIIEVLLFLKRFASLQIGDLKGPALIRLVQSVLQQFQEGYYRIVVGNQLELTPCRLMLNTNGLSKAEVTTVLQLMRQPGHYQFICYSSAEHFPAALELFRAKPLVKFNFFLPLQELPPFEELIKVMEKHASTLLLKVYSYAGLIKRLAKEGYLAVNSIFYALGERP